MEMPPPPPTFMGACEKEIELKVRKNTVKLKLQTTFLAYFTFFTYNYLFIYFFFVSQDFLVESAPPPLLSTCMYITCTDKKPTFFSLHISALRIFCYRKHSQNSHSIAQLILSIIILILDFCGFTKMISIAIF